MRLKLFSRKCAWLSLGALALPLGIAISCTSSIADRVSGVNRSTQVVDEYPDNVPASYADLQLNLDWPFSVATLDAVADQIPGENDLPWRYGITTEALNQTFSFLRALAIKLGWNYMPAQTWQRSQQVVGVPNTVYLTDQANANGTPSTVLNTFNDAPIINGEPASVVAFLDNLRKLGAASTNNAWGASFERKLSALPLLGDTNVSEYHLIEYLQSGLGNYRLARLINEGSVPDDGLTDPYVQIETYTGIGSQADHALWSWIDANKPGDMMVAVRHAYRESENGIPTVRGFATRLVRVPDLNFIYPQIDSAIFTREFVPALQLLFNKFLRIVTPSLVSSARSAGALFAPDLEDMLAFLLGQGTISQSPQFANILHELNNGSHHLLSIVAFWKGFDKSFTTDPAWRFIYAGPSLLGFSTWVVNQPLKGLREESEATVGANSNLFRWFRSNHVGILGLPQGSTAGYDRDFLWLYFRDFPAVVTQARGSFFTNRHSVAALVAAHRAVIIDLEAPVTNSLRHGGANEQAN